MTTFKNCTNCAHSYDLGFSNLDLLRCHRTGYYCEMEVKRDYGVCGERLKEWVKKPQTPKPPTWKEIAIAFVNKRAV